MGFLKKILFFILLLVFAVSIFLIFSYFLNRDSGKGALQVTSVPKSKVYLDGKLLGETPLCKCEYPNMIDSGEHSLRLVPLATGLNPIDQKITISSSVLTVVDRTFGKGALSEGSVITLSKIPDKNDAQIMVISFPDKVQAFLDSNLIGMTPINVKNQTESDHEIKLSKEGYKDKVIRIRAVKGYRLEVTAFLSVAEDNGQPSSVSAQPTPTTVKVASVTIGETPTGFLRVRSESSLNGAEIGQVNPGEKFDLVSEAEGWYEIKLKNGKTGWISSQYATKE
jgi:hypothetical protein